MFNSKLLDLLIKLNAEILVQPILKLKNKCLKAETHHFF